ncbi:uncharacterized protein [Anoplolepis gracilipes]|uniref:uncharacterized protein n=1 Tax=Anoplolepis gracilipes TaxID=354296 RepID=UPI003B9E1FF9
MARVALLVTMLTILGYMSQAIPVPENVEPKSELENFRNLDEIKEQFENLMEDKIEDWLKNTFPDVNVEIEKFEVEVPKLFALTDEVSDVNDANQNIISEQKWKNKLKKVVKKIIKEVIKAIL